LKDAIHKAGFDYVTNVYHDNPDFIGLGELAVQNLDWITKGGWILSTRIITSRSFCILLQQFRTVRLSPNVPGTPIR